MDKTFEKLTHKLLNFSRRNRILHCPDKKTGIKFRDISYFLNEASLKEDSVSFEFEIFDKDLQQYEKIKELIDDYKSLKKDDSLNLEFKDDENLSKLNELKKQIFIEAPELDEFIIKNEKSLETVDLDVFFDVPFQPWGKALTPRLNRCRLNTKRISDEHGQDTLYFSFGVLKWKDPKEKIKEYFSPLLFFPVEILLKKNPKRFVIKDFEEGSFQNNYVLNLILNKNFDAPENIIPDLKTSGSFYESIELFFETLEKNLKEHLPNLEYEIIRSVKFENFALDFLYWEAKKFKEKYQDDELIKILCGDSYKKDPLPPLPNGNSLDALDQAFKSKDLNNCVLEADSSQLEVIHKAQSGANLVVTGPPGTGKSQTIVNLISDFVARGKKVLFVCAKKVALEVVYDRLKLDDRNNLQKLALPLFESNINKKDFYNSIYEDFKERVDSISKQNKQEEFVKEFTQKQSSQNILNKYASVLLEKTGQMQVSPWYAYGQWANSYFQIDCKDVSFNQSVYSTISLEDFQELSKLIQNLSNFSHLFPQEKMSFYSFFNWNEFSPIEIEKIKQKIPSLIDEINKLIEIFKKVNIENIINDISIEEVNVLAKDGIDFLQSLKNNENLQTELQYIKNSLNELIAKYTKYKEKNVIEYKQNITPDEFVGIDNQIQEKGILKFKYFNFYFQESNPDISIDDFFTKLGSNLTNIKQALDVISKKTFLKDIPLHEIFKYTNNWEFFSIFNRWDPAIFSSELFKKEFISFGIALKKANTFANELKEKGINLNKISHEEIEEIYFNFKNNYSSFFSKFTKDYKNDYQKFNHYFYGNVKFSKEDILSTLQNLREFCQQREEIKNLSIFNSDLIKNNHINDLSQWSDILEGLERLQENTYPLWLTNALKQNISEVVDCFKEINVLISEEESIEIFNSLFLQEIQDRISNPSKLKSYIVFLENTYSVLKSIEQYFTHGMHWTLRTIPNCIKEIDYLNNLQKEFFNISNSFEKSPFSQNFFYFAENEWSEKKDLFNCAQNLINSLGQDLLYSFLSNVKTSEFSLIQDKINAIQNIFKDIGFQMNTTLSILDMQNKISDANDHIDDLHDWMRFKVCVNTLISTYGFKDTIESIISQNIEKNYVYHVFCSLFWTKWIEECGKENQILWKTGINLKGTVLEFGEKDKKLQKLKCQEILEKYNALNELEHPWETRILKEQANRKRSHMPLRKFIPQTQDTMFQLKKCWLMSPQALVNYLPLDKQQTPLFDVVIFDEASQLTPQEAMSGLVRGKQVIVVGDPKQLPPTRFFIKELENEEEDDERFAVEDYESVLDILSVSLPETQQPMLRWHYRCKYESLIAASNKYFYRNKLVTFPSNMNSKEGLEFNYNKDIYDRGNSQTNKGEAQRIVDNCFEFWKTMNASGETKSLGIICLNSNQEELVRDLLEAQMRDSSNIAMLNFFDENSTQKEEFFIKNLENVQGDERDVIFLSIGYGYDESGGMKNNFGPLNKAGGGRRLNVAISRAREKMTVFSSIRHEDIKGTVGEGGNILRKFLQYAEMCPQVGVQEALFTPDTEVNSGNYYNDTDSPFEDSVISILEELGYTVHKQIGVSGFKIDIAIVDPNDSGRYLLGIECDGATYHGTHCARERDRLRQEILERRGWTIFRIWSTDWFSNPQAIIQELKQTIQHLKND